jgi:flagellum-specific peptidoglycan hydrolase FlgJ
MNFISEIAPHAQRISKEFNILPSLIIAQAIHESNWGKSGLATKGKNLFGIKGNYHGQSITMPTWEHYNGKDVKINAAFRKYPGWYESLCDLAYLYCNGVSWDRKKYHAVIGETNYKKAANAVHKAGYATDPNYASKLIRTIESNNLTKFDGEDEEEMLKEKFEPIEHKDLSPGQRAAVDRLIKIKAVAPNYKPSEIDLTTISIIDSAFKNSGFYDFAKNKK